MTDADADTRKKGGRKERRQASHREINTPRPGRIHHVRLAPGSRSLCTSDYVRIHYDVYDRSS